MKKILSIILTPFRVFKIYHYITLIALVAIGIFNFQTTFDPTVQQLRQEKDIHLSFEKWWNEERAEKFKKVGLTPDKKLKKEILSRHI